MKKLLFQKQVSGGSCAHGFFEADFLPGFKTEGFSTREAANDFARRIVAAFNATRGVPVETLETDPLTLDGVEDTFNRLKAQNAQLLDALLEISKGEGRFSKDTLKHAENTIADMRLIALNAIAAEAEKTETP